MRFPAQSVVEDQYIFIALQSLLSRLLRWVRPKDENLVAGLGKEIRDMTDGLRMAYVVACKVMPRNTVSKKRRNPAEMSYTLVFDSME